MYGFRSSEPTRVECSLVHAQNSLLRQSRRDEKGEDHPDGWGIGAYLDSEPYVERSTWAAYHGEEFSQSAARIYARTVIAHVRRATTGPACPENTHPFRDGRSLFAHNGTVEGIPAIRRQLQQLLDPIYRPAIRGTTDSELVFLLLLSLYEQAPDQPKIEILREGLREVIRISERTVPGGEISLNTLWTDGEFMVGSRLGRSLWYVSREGIHDCEVCGFPHIRHHPGESYAAIVVASEPISDEAWREIPERTVFSIDRHLKIHFEPLGS